jgi:hypothetical protein
MAYYAPMIRRTRPTRGAFLPLGTLALTLLLATAGRPAPYDRVPQSDWTYDILASLAGRGLVAGHSARDFRGDLLLTRDEVAGILQPLLVDAHARATEADRVLLARLARDYRTELRQRGVDLQPIEEWARRVGRPLVTGMLALRGFHDDLSGDRSDDGGDKIWRASLQAPLGRDFIVAVAGSTQRRLASDDPDAFNQLDKLYLRLDSHGWTVEFGRDYAFWGPGYNAGLLLSDNAPSWTSLNVSKEFSLGRLGIWRFSQRMGSFRRDPAQMYLFTRRLETQLSPRFGISLQEGFISDGLPAAGEAIFLPFYLWIHTNHGRAGTSQKDNYLASVDASYTVSPRLRLFGQFLADDIVVDVNRGARQGNRTGAVVGAELPHLLRMPDTKLHLEWGYTSGGRFGGTYRELNPDIDWYYRGLPIGSPMGNNHRGPLIRLESRIGRTFGAAQYEHESQTDPEPAVDLRERIVLYGAYDIRDNFSLGLRLDRTQLGGARRTRVSLLANFSF